MSAKRRLARNVTEARIIEAAVQLFAQHGFKGTSTRDIADLANVNEATLFRHFPRKAELFWAAADSRLNAVKLNRELQHGLSSDADPQTVIPMIVSFVTENMFQRRELMRLLYVAGFELAGAERLLGEHLGPIFDAINSYFRRCASKGMIEDFDPVVATLGLAGAVGAHYTLQPFFSGDQHHKIPEYTRFLLNALQKNAASSDKLFSSINEK
jgi:AcrR family transcriptional regulator